METAINVPDSAGSFPRVCISSTRGGGGKTLVTLGMGRALARRGLVVKPFKKGPDFIDAAWLGHACGHAATNLDPFFLTPGQCLGLFTRALRAALQPKAQIISLIEGNRGLYDGLDSSGAVSTAVLARTLNAPIILCLDCAKSTRTIAAILRGLISFEEGLDFGGVILNRVASPRHEKNLRNSIEQHTPLRVLGALPSMRDNPLPERHMGLASAGAHLAENLDVILESLADLLEAHADIDAILEIARKAGPFPARESPPIFVERSKSGNGGQAAPCIGYVEDRALWFYYPENLAALRHAGAKLVKLSLFDSGAENEKNWLGLHGLYLGGGFPEDFAPELSASPLLARLRRMAEAGLPIYAECGGLIVLCSSLRRGDKVWPLAQVFDAQAQWHDKPRGLGYIEAQVVRENPFFPLGMSLRGHEFHYSSCVFPHGIPDFALRVKRGSGLLQVEEKKWDAMLYKNVWASYTHIFAPAVPDWAQNFTAAARRQQIMQV